jgi:hypothetical protein
MKQQRGAALLIILTIVGIGAAYLLIGALTHSSASLERDRKTQQALALAKEAVIAYAVTNTTNPGQLPCPEDTTRIGTITEGTAQGVCSSTMPTIGRLAWRDLGLGNLRDGNGDRLWYVISPGFRYTAATPINSNTQAQLTVDGIANTAIAIIFSPGSAINAQVRPVPTAAAPPNVTQYLDLTNNDGDNIFATTGPSTTFNDKLLVITPNDLFPTLENLVVKKVAGEIDTFFTANQYYPNPALFSDTQCLARPGIAIGNCLTNAGTTEGRISAEPSIWGNASILRGTVGSTPDWFQRNGWRELVYYAIAPACAQPAVNCSGAGFLTVNPPSATANKQYAIAVAGQMLTGQVRTTNANKTTLSNYLETQNASTGDNTFTKTTRSSTFNDTVSYK